MLWRELKTACCQNLMYIVHFLKDDGQWQSHDLNQTNRANETTPNRTVTLCLQSKTLSITKCVLIWPLAGLAISLLRNLFLGAHCHASAIIGLSQGCPKSGPRAACGRRPPSMRPAASSRKLLKISII